MPPHPRGLESELLDRVFFALSDPVRRAILQRLDTGTQLVSELAAPFDISLQAVSRHIHVLVRAGSVRQERTGRVSRCSLDAGPIFTAVCQPVPGTTIIGKLFFCPRMRETRFSIFAAAVWINRSSKYWQAQFDLLAAALGQNDLQPGSGEPPGEGRDTK